MTKPLKRNIGPSRPMTSSAIRGVPHQTVAHQTVALLQCILPRPMIDILSQLFHRRVAREVDESRVLALQMSTIGLAIHFNRLELLAKMRKAYIPSVISPFLPDHRTRVMGL